MDAYQKKLLMMGKVRKLKALAGPDPSTPEQKSAEARGRKIADEYNFSYDTLKAEPAQKQVLPSAEHMRAFTDQVKRTFPGVDDEDYSKYAADSRGEKKKPYFDSDLSDEEVPR